MELTYTIEPTVNKMYQVRMSDMFVCYSNHTDENEIDEYLKEEGFNSRKKYFEACLEDYDECYWANNMQTVLCELHKMTLLLGTNN